MSPYPASSTLPARRASHARGIHRRTSPTVQIACLDRATEPRGACRSGPSPHSHSQRRLSRGLSCPTPLLWGCWAGLSDAATRREAKQCNMHASPRLQRGQPSPKCQLRPPCTPRCAPSGPQRTQPCATTRLRVSYGRFSTTETDLVSDYTRRRARDDVKERLAHGVSVWWRPVS